MNAKPHSCFISSLMKTPELKKKAQSYREFRNKEEKSRRGKVKIKKTPSLHRYWGLFLIGTLDKYLRRLLSLKQALDGSLF